MLQNDNYIFIKYEDLLNYFENIMNKIKEFDLTIKDNIVFPTNKKKYNLIRREIIITNPNIYPYYENKLEYI